MRPNKRNPEELMAAEKAVERLTKDLETSRQYTARENERLSKDLENLGFTPTT